MHITIEAQPRGGLRLIKDLPVHRLGRLEGYNGIGKSAAIRLLRVCVGDRPYLPREQRLWDSFREYLGPCVVYISGLSGGATLEWRLDPQTWPVLVTSPLEDIGTILLNGEPTDLDAVKRLVQVERIVGNEGLVPTLVRELQPHRMALESAFGVGSLVRTRQTEVDELLLAVETELRFITEIDLDGAARKVHDIHQTQATVHRDLVGSQQREADLGEIEELRRRLADVRNHSGDLQHEAHELSARMTVADQRLKTLDRELADAGQRQGAQPAALKELSLAQANARRSDKHLQEVLLQARAAAGALDLSGDPRLIDVPALAAEAASARDKAAQQLRAVFSTPRVVEVAGRVIAVLDQAQRSGLGDEVIEIAIDDDPGGNQVTIAQLADRLARSVEKFKRAEPPVAAQELQAEVERQLRRLRLLDALQEVQNEVSRRAGLTAKATERLETATRGVSALTGQRLGELIAERESVTEELRTLAVERAAVIRADAELGGGLTENELAARLATKTAAANIDEADLAEEAARTHTHLVSLQRRETLLAAEERELAAEERHARAQVGESLIRLREDDTFAWARQAVPAIGNLPKATPQTQEALKPVLKSVQGARQRAEDATAAPIQISNVVRVLQEQLDSPAAASPSAEDDSPYLAAARAWFGDEVSNWFRQPLILSTLFEGATSVRVDLSDMTVNWSVEAEEYTRPLTAFSSGEQAFAYTRAQLQILDAETHTPDQIIALDEFGAYISRPWLYRLESYLEERVKTHPSDRILLVLPLTRTEEELSQTGADADTLAQAENVGYFVTRLFDDR